MVGGEVIGVTRTSQRPGHARVLVGTWYRDNKSGRTYRADEEAEFIWVKEGDAVIQVGDFLWWTKKTARWTPRRSWSSGRGKSDVVLVRV